MKKVIKYDAVQTAKPALKRVAAYARVSMETERLNHSLSAQISHYSDLIQKHPGWQYAGVYADNGISGTGTEKRTEFLRLLEDCENGRIDIVLTKSISRFARNTVDLLNTVRHLKELGIAVIFEKENIDSLSSDGELMLTLLASFAQEESRSISENVKWGTRKRFAEGIPNGHFQIYGYRWEDDHLVVQPEEAEIVRLIYGNFLKGLSAEQTEKQLEAMGVKSYKGQHFSNSSIRQILGNITYTGNLLFQKEYVVDPISKKSRINRGELPQYFVENTHEAIIPMETYRAVQDEILRRRELGCFANTSLTLNCFSTKIKCGLCGRSFVRSTRTNRAKMSQLGNHYTFWACTSSKRSNCPRCKSGTIREDVLKEECAKVLGLDEFDEDVFSERVIRITIPHTGLLVFDFSDGSTLEHEWYRNSRKDSWTEECRKRASEYRRRNPPNREGVTCLTSKVRCGECGANFHRQAWKNAAGEPGARWYCYTHRMDKDKCSMSRTVDEEVIKSLSAEAMGLEEFDEVAFTERVDHIKITGAGALTVVLKNGETFDATFSTKKKGTPWTEERKASQGAAIRASFTDERRQKMSEKMKQIRSERYWSSRKK